MSSKRSAIASFPAAKYIISYSLILNQAASGFLREWFRCSALRRESELEENEPANHYLESLEDLTRK